MSDQETGIAFAERDPLYSQTFESALKTLSEIASEMYEHFRAWALEVKEIMSRSFMDIGEAIRQILPLSIYEAVLAVATPKERHFIQYGKTKRIRKKYYNRAMRRLRECGKEGR